MSLNITQLETSLQTKINAIQGNADSKEFLLLSKSIESLDAGMISEVANIASLPAANSSTGRTVWVTANSSLYYSDGSAWQQALGIGYTGSASTLVGFTGSVGLIGFTGSIGFTGYTGSLGAVGFTGSQGIQGVAGISGAEGYTGSQGIAGYNGSVGFTGSQGIQGTQGFTGSQGIQGITGFTGSQGDTGALGFTGSQGIQGITGFTGSQGDTGSQGTTGFTGSQGIQGFTGSTGALGFTGSQGAQGFTGSAGSYNQDLNTTNSVTFANVSVTNKANANLFVSTGLEGLGADGFLFNTAAYLADANAYTGHVIFSNALYTVFNGASVLSYDLDGNSLSRITAWGNMIPEGNVQYDLGSPTNVWQNVYANNIVFEDGSSITNAAGATGFTGSSGATGFAGSAGVAGYTGSVGATGFTGSAGNTANLTLQQFRETLVSSGNITGNVVIDVANGSIFSASITGNISNLAISNVTDGTSATLILTNTGTFTLTTTAAWKWAGNVKTLTATANSIDIISVIYSGNVYYASLTKGYV